MYYQKLGIIKKWQSSSNENISREQRTIEPDAPITREEAFAVISRAFKVENTRKVKGYSDLSDISVWARGNIWINRCWICTRFKWNDKTKRNYYKGRICSINV